MILILGTWIYVTFSLYREYKKSIRDSLSLSVDEESTTLLSSAKVFASNVDNENAEKSLFALNMLEKTNPIIYTESLPLSFNCGNDHVKEYILNEYENKHIPLSKDILTSKTASEPIKQKISETERNIKNYYSQISEKNLLEMSKSSDIENRIRASKHLSLTTKNDNNTILLGLLRDIEPKVKTAAILACTNKNSTELSSTIIDYLGVSQYMTTASSTLVKIGEPCLESLEHYFYKTGIKDETLSEIIEIYKAINTDKSVSLLLNKLTYPNRTILLDSISALNECDYSIKTEDQHIILNAIKQQIGVISWNLAALNSARTIVKNEYLLPPLEEEIDISYSLLFSLLSIAHDSKSITQVKSNLETGTAESIGFAIELLELFIDEELKPILFPLLEDLSISEKVKRLSDHYPLETVNPDNVIEEILNRDPNLLSDWCKACAIYSIDHLSESLILNLSAQLFNPNRIVRETCSYIFYNLNPGKFKKVGSRIEIKQLTKIENDIELFQKDEKNLLIEKVLYLKKNKQFSNLLGTELLLIAEYLKIDSYNKDDIICEKGSQSNDLFFIVEGNVDLNSNKETISSYKNNNTFGHFQILSSDDESTGFIATTATQVFVLNEEDVDILISLPFFSEILIEIIDARLNN